MRTSTLVAAMLAAIVLAGCAQAPQRPPPAPEVAPVAQEGAVLARDDAFAVVVAGPGEDLATLAQRYLGDRGKRWRISEFNDIDEVRPGQTVVIPLKVTNPTGVYPNGHLTVPILCYHRFGPKPSQLAVTPAAFEAQMEHLARNGYHVISLAQLAGFLERGEPVPRKSVVLTIDDGYRSTYEIAFPILRKHGFQATVFLYSDFVGAPDALTWPQMKEMEASGLVSIQPHSKTHANFATRLAGETDAKYRERIRAEVDTPIRLIQDRLAASSFAFAFPYGDVNDMVVDLLKRDGVRLGVTVTPGGNAFYAYPFMLRRSMVFGGDSIDAFRAKLATFRAGGTALNAATGSRGALALCALAMLAACAQAPVATQTTSDAPRASAADDPGAQAVARHRQRAQQARERGDLAAAAVEWRIVVLLAPGEAAYRAQLDAVNAAIRQGVREQLQAGSAAQKAGDNERAMQASLRALALDPANEDAAKALRDIDRQRMARIQGDRAQKLRPVDMAALKSGTPDAGAAYDLEQPLEMLRAGDLNGGLRELTAYVDANPGNRAARQRIGSAVADRARELQNKGSREQAFALYEQAVALRGESTPEWDAQMQSLRRSLSDEYYGNGERAYRTDVALAIKQWETSLRYDPKNLKAANRLRDARAAQEKLKGIAPAK